MDKSNKNVIDMHIVMFSRLLSLLPNLDGKGWLGGKHFVSSGDIRCCDIRLWAQGTQAPPVNYSF